jgi:hypothetical protein
MVGRPSLRRRTFEAIAAVLALMAAAALGVGLTRGGPTPLSWTSTESREPIRTVTLVQGHVYTFAQAVRAGVTPSLAEQERESGLPLCGTKPPKSAAARAAYGRTVRRNDGDTCMADPRRAIFGVADLDALEQMVASISFPPAGGARASGGRSPRAS